MDGGFPFKVKVFIHTCRLFYTNLKMCIEWVVARAYLESCVLGKECVILLFKKNMRV